MFHLIFARAKVPGNDRKVLGTRVPENESTSSFPGAKVRGNESFCYPPKLPRGKSRGHKSRLKSRTQTISLYIVSEKKF